MSDTAVGREPITIVEIQQPYCVNRYGVSPCTATLSAQNPQKCFNTRRSCQDLANYDGSGVIYWRFSESKHTGSIGQSFENSGNNIYGNPIPSVTSTTTNATKINIGNASDNVSPLGTRGSVVINFMDHAYDDSLSDFYLSDRNYIASDRGTFWGKWLARNPYYEGYYLKVYDGYKGDLLEDMRQAIYVIDSIDGPGAKGQVTVKAKDILSLADDKKAMAPPASDATLVNDLLAGDTPTSIQVSGTIELLFQELEPDGDRYLIKINDEIIQYLSTSQLANGNVNLVGITRGMLGTTPEDHDAGDSCQRVLYLNDVTPWRAVQFLLEDVAGVPSEFIPYSDWQAECGTWLSSFTIDGALAEPTSVNQLIGEIQTQSLFYIWWDEYDSEIKLKTIRPEVAVTSIITDNGNIIADTQSINRKTDERFSRVFVYYNPLIITEAEDVEDFGNVVGRISVDSELNYRQDRTKQVFSRWLRTGAQAGTLAFRMLSRFKDTPQYLKLRVDIKDNVISPGDVVSIETRINQDVTGATQRKKWQVYSRKIIEKGSKVEFEFIEFEFEGRYCFWTDADAPTYAQATDEQRNSNTLGWWSYEGGQMSDGTEGYRWI